MDILTVSIWLRYLGICGENIVFPANAYQGEYVIDIAQALKRVHGGHFHSTGTTSICRIYRLMNLKVAIKKFILMRSLREPKLLLGDKYQIYF